MAEKVVRTINDVVDVINYERKFKDISISQIEKGCGIGQGKIYKLTKHDSLFSRVVSILTYLNIKIILRHENTKEEVDTLITDFDDVKSMLYREMKTKNITILQISEDCEEIALRLKNWKYIDNARFSNVIKVLEYFNILMVLKYEAVELREYEVKEQAKEILDVIVYEIKNQDIQLKKLNKDCNLCGSSIIRWKNNNCNTLLSNIITLLTYFNIEMVLKYGLNKEKRILTIDDVINIINEEKDIKNINISQIENDCQIGFGLIKQWQTSNCKARITTVIKILKYLNVKIILRWV